MEEARYSINIRFSVKGFDSQLTVRGDVKDEIEADFAAAIEFLETHGALPERRWENGKNGHGHAQALPKSDALAVNLGAGQATVPTAKPAAVAATAQPKPVATVVARAQVENPNARACPSCGVSGEMELISFNDRKSGQPKSAYKCQACQKWLK